MIYRLGLEGFIPVNCYVIEEDGDCFIIDPGSQREKILDFVKEKNLNVKGILLTHGHFDHTGEIDLFPVPVYIHESEKDFLNDDELNLSMPFGVRLNYKSKLSGISVRLLKDKEKIDLNGNIISVIHSPGHTKGHVCYYYEKEKTLFSGDVIFFHSAGRTDFPTGNDNELYKSVSVILDSFDDDVVICPGHEKITSVAEEKANNPYFQKN